MVLNAGLFLVVEYFSQCWFCSFYLSKRSDCGQVFDFCSSQHPQGFSRGQQSVGLAVSRQTQSTPELRARIHNQSPRHPFLFIHHREDDRRQANHGTEKVDVCVWSALTFFYTLRSRLNNFSSQGIKMAFHLLIILLNHRWRHPYLGRLDRWLPRYFNCCHCYSLFILHHRCVRERIISVSPCSAKIAAGAVVCVESEIRGDVTIGENLHSTSQ